MFLKVNELSWYFSKLLNQLIATFERQMKLIFFFIQLLYAQESNEKQPNIIFVVADDLGWADVNWNNKEIAQILNLGINWPWSLVIHCDSK